MLREQRDTIRVMLLKNNLSQTWLINRLAEDGLSVDKAELSGALNGSRQGEKIEKIITASLDILNGYEEQYANGRKKPV